MVFSIIRQIFIKQNKVLKLLWFECVPRNICWKCNPQCNLTVVIRGGILERWLDHRNEQLGAHCESGLGTPRSVSCTLCCDAFHRVRMQQEATNQIQPRAAYKPHILWHSAAAAQNRLRHIHSGSLPSLSVLKPRQQCWKISVECL